MFLTGGHGYLGRALTRAATSAGWMVFEPSRSELDIRNEWAVREAVTDSRADVVVNCAYIQSGSEAWSTNVDGVSTIARASVAAGARLIHLSTDVVFPGRSTPYDEGAETSPVHDYGRSKAAAEASLAMIDPNAAVIRTSILYDTEHVSRQLRTILDAAKGDVPFEFFVDEIRSFTPVHDLASSIMDLCYHDYAGVLHVAGPEPISRYDFACRYAKRHGFNPDKIRPSAIEERHGPRPARVVLDSAKSAGLLTTRVRGVTELLGM